MAMLKVANISGKPPVARCMHSACGFNKYLIIHGGRNDDLFPQIGNSALNDLHLYNIQSNSWTTLAMYGEVPSSRWGHCLVSSPQTD
mmetsp:Transcript_11516/g.8016  ORF Transcript_11516/g.8016 Transcript_11516/m.8016 type:complete len:87 (+) Transcript_11516:771-1031(+)